MQSITAIIPMRHNSQRVPRKNYRDFGGEPLYRHIVQTVLACAVISQVVIDTDSPFIMEDAARHFPSVTLLERPEHLRDGKISMNDVLLNTTAQLEADFFLQTHSTNPLLKTETLTQAIAQFFDAMPTYDSMFSVTRIQTRFWNQLTQPVNHNPNILLRTQDLPPLYEENSLFYLFQRETLLENRNRIGKRPLMVEVDRIEAQDIDEEIDFKIAELLYLQQMNKLYED